MAGTITAAALANIKQAANEAGIDSDRIVIALESVPYTVTWNDGGLTGSAAEFRNAMRDAAVAVGIPESNMDLFCTRIIALDTGLTGNVTAIVPNVVGMTLAQAWQALEKAGLRAGAATLTADQGASYPIGDVSAQNPAASANDAPGSTVALTVQKGQTVPNLVDSTADAAIDALEAIYLDAGNLGPNIAGTAEADDDIITTTADHGLVAGDRVWLRSLTGGTGLTQGLLYYVRDVSTTKKFKVALKEGDTAVNITVDATAIVFNKFTATIAAPLGPLLSGTAEADDDKVTITAHGLANNDTLYVIDITGGTGLTGGTVYHVINKTDNTFELSLSQGGAAIDIESDATAITVKKILPADDVVSQDIAAGTFQDPDTDVTFTIGGIAVPDWSQDGSGTDGAMTSAEFASALGTAGLIAGTATDNEADEVTAVVSSSPAAGTYVQKGSAVDYTFDAV